MRIWRWPTLLGRRDWRRRGRSLTTTAPWPYLARGGPGDADRALDDLARAIDADPESAGALVNRAAAWLERGDAGDLERAFADLERAIELQPDLAAAWLNRGSAYLQRGPAGRHVGGVGGFQ